MKKLRENGGFYGLFVLVDEVDELGVIFVDSLAFRDITGGE